MVKTFRGNLDHSLSFPVLTTLWGSSVFKNQKNAIFGSLKIDILQEINTSPHQRCCFIAELSSQRTDNKIVWLSLDTNRSVHKACLDQLHSAGYTLFLTSDKDKKDLKMGPSLRWWGQLRHIPSDYRLPPQRWMPEAPWVLSSPSPSDTCLQTDPFNLHSCLGHVMLAVSDSPRPPKMSVMPQAGLYIAQESGCVWPIISLFPTGICHSSHS